MLILGIDIGATGAIALLRGEELICVEDMPCLNDGPAGRRAVNGVLLSDIIVKTGAAKAFVEFVGARPGEGATGAFAFGRSRGVVEGVLGAHGITTSFITPASWKRTVGLAAGKDKDASRSLAIQLWPKHADKLARVKDDGRAESALIAIAGMKRELAVIQ